MIALLLAAQLTHAAPIESRSAIRLTGESYLAHMHSRVRVVPFRSRTAEEAAVPFGQPLPATTSWDSMQTMTERFKRVRDERWLEQTYRPGFLRRISWIYPDDGCFARAGLAIFNFAKWAIQVPGKIFAFGDLSVQTANSPFGNVSWWYHVAPVVEVLGEKYVLDPAIEPGMPLPIADWISRMSNRPSSVQVAICGSGSYDPSDLCDKDTDGVESTAQADQPYYLDNEWDRLIELHRDPNQELGDNPPWH